MKNVTKKKLIIMVDSVLALGLFMFFIAGAIGTFSQILI